MIAATATMTAWPEPPPTREHPVPTCIEANHLLVKLLEKSLQASPFLFHLHIGCEKRSQKPGTKWNKIISGHQDKEISAQRPLVVGKKHLVWDMKERQVCIWGHWGNEVGISVKVHL